MQVFIYPPKSMSATMREDVTAHVSMPVTEKFALDESLDMAHITLKGIERAEPFTPFQWVQILGGAQSSTVYGVADDQVTERAQGGLYDHEVLLVEPTKWLERFVVGTKTVTQPLLKRFGENENKIEPQAVEPSRLTDKDPRLASAYTSPLFTSSDVSVTITPPYKVLLGSDGRTAEEIFDAYRPAHVLSSGYVRAQINGTTLIERKYDGSDYDVNTGANREKSIFSDIGTVKVPPGLLSITYNIEWSMVGGVGAGGDSGTGAGTYFVSIINTTAAKRKTLADAARSFILAAETINEGESPRFVLDTEDAERLDLNETAELTATGATLREALTQVGGQDESIPRLVVDLARQKYLIKFDRLDLSEEADLSSLTLVRGATAAKGVEEYATALDSTSGNLVQYDEEGLAEPGGKAWRTVRTESQTYRITEGTAVIKTDRPIERILSLSVCYITGESNGAPTYSAEKDITKYCYEATEYAALSSYSDSFPSSKAYALQYTTGGENITGLDFELPNAVSNIFTKPALINIINREFGTDYNDFNALPFGNILFRVRYLPNVTARVRSRRPDQDSLGMESVLVYNQGSGKVDSRLYGRNLFGAAVRLGNAAHVLPYLAPIAAKIPAAGEILPDGKTIASVSVATYGTYKRVDVEAVERFNRLSQYVGIKSNVRLYEVSERLTQDRHIIYEDALTLTTEEGGSGSPAMIGLAFATECATILRGGTPTAAITSAILQGYKGNEALTKVVLPVLALPVGNALRFAFSYADNFSAGGRIDPYKLFTDGFASTQTNTPYANEFGEIDFLAVRLTNQQVADDLDRKEYADAIPSYIGAEVAYIADTGTGSLRWKIDKDSRETIHGTYQVNLLGGGGVQIAPTAAEVFRPFCGGSAGLSLRIYDDEISPLATAIDGGTPATISVATTPEGVGIIATPTTGGKSWAIVNEAGKIYASRNTPITKGEAFRLYLRVSRYR